MPLKHVAGAPIVGAWGIHYNMVLPSMFSVECTVTRGALDELARGDGTITDSEQIIIFALRRDVIECIASQKYDTGKLDHGMVVVDPDDVRGYRTATRACSCQMEP